MRIKGSRKLRKIQLSMSPEERKRHRQEINEILSDAQREREKKEKREREKKHGKFHLPFSPETIRSVLRGLKFKSADANVSSKTQPTPVPPTGIQKVKESGTIKKVFTNYDRWYRLVTEKEEDE